MFVSNLFSSLHKSYVLLRFSSDSQAQKVKVGKLIKKLNKENRSLFGELLETRSEKRKRESRKEPDGFSLSNSVGSETSSEVMWYSRTMPASCVVKLAKNANSKYEIPDKDSLVKKTSSGRKISSNADHSLKSGGKKEHEVLGPVQHKINCSLPVVSGKEVLVENVAQRTLRKQHALELPDIIIRNIPTFPLLNESKRVDCVTLDNIKFNSENIDNKDYLSYPSVSKILNATMSESSLAALKRWRQKLITELGEEGFLTYYRGLLDRGSQFHNVIHCHLSGTPETDLKLDPQIEGCWHSLRDVVRDVAEAKVLESHVVHSELRYRGVIDCVAQYKGKDVLIEWKKSDKHKPEIEKTYDAPLQLCAYVGAMNYDAKYNFQVHGGLVVVAYSDGSPANIFKMTMTDCNKYWKLWLNRLQQYWQQRQDQQRHQDKVEEFV